MKTEKYLGLLTAFLICAAAVFPVDARASDLDAGFAGAYLNSAGGARANAMGRTFVGIADGAEAVLWNQAGLGFLRPNTLNVMHTRTVEEFNLDSLFYAQPLFNLGAFGIGYIRQASDNLPLIDDLNRELGSFNDTQQTFSLAYGFQVIRPRPARKLLRRLALGGAIKYSRQSMYDISADGWGVDIGALAHLKYSLTAGIRIQNVVPPALKYETATDIFPRLLTTGIAVDLWRSRLIAALDITKALDSRQKVKYTMGLEAVLLKDLKLRGGYKFKNAEYTLGFGYTFGLSQVLYTANAPGMGFTHDFGFNYEFGGFPVTITADPEYFSPVGLKKNTTFMIRLSDSMWVYGWTLQVMDQNGNLARSFRGNGLPPSEVVWDGRTQSGTMAAAGNYIYTLQVTNAKGKKETTPSQIVRVLHGTPLDMLEMKNE